MAYLDSFAHKEAYSNQVEIPGIASVIHEDVINQATYANHCELSSTVIMAVYNDVTNAKGMVQFGTRVSDFCIEWGTAVQFYNGLVKHIIPVRISDTKFAIVYVHAGDDDGYIIAGTVAGTVPTLGTEKEFKDASTCTPIGAQLWDTEKVLIAYANTTTNGQCIVAVTTDINNITLGAEAIFKATTDITGYISLNQVCIHSATLASVVYRVSATVTQVVTLSLSTTTITPNTAGLAAFGGSADIRYPSIGALSATAFVLAYTDVTASNCGNAQIGTISTTTITAGASEYTFDGNNYAARVPRVAIISSTLFAVSGSNNSGTAVGVGASVGSVASTVITFGAVLDIQIATQKYNYPTRKTDTLVNITFTKTGELTFSYLSQYNNQFVCGMLTQNYNVLNQASMCVKVATAGVGEQIEISSLYLKSNMSGFFMTTDIAIDHTGSLYYNGTLANNKMYSTSNIVNQTASSPATAESVRIGMSNEPIILTAGQSLYASIDTNQHAFPVRGSCTVFGLKRTA